MAGIVRMNVRELYCSEHSYPLLIAQLPPMITQDFSISFLFSLSSSLTKKTVLYAYKAGSKTLI